MLFKWFMFGCVAGFILGLLNGAGFDGAVFLAILIGALAVSFRKWLFRTFWG